MSDSLFSAAEMRGIAAQAATIDERLAGCCVPAEITGGEARARERLAEWRQTAAAGDAAVFAKRLAAVRHDEASILPLLGPVRLPDTEPLPEWAAHFAPAAAAMAGLLALPADDAGEPAPFGELLWPAASVGWQRLGERLDPAALGLFAPEAQVALRRGLLNRLVAVVAPALFGDFSLFRRFEARGAARFPSPQSRVIYDAYLVAWGDGRGRSFFTRKPVAARLIGATIAHWLDGTAEVADRLRDDLPALRETFTGGGELGLVTGIDADLSDPHHGGRRVAVLQFAAGLRVVYKPKDLHIDRVWGELLHRLDRQGMPVPVAAPPVLPRDGYGWAGFVATADQPDAEKDWAAHCRRAGGLLALIYLLRGTDFHYENVIDAAAGPVPVDLETLLTPNMAAAVYEDSSDPAAAAAEQEMLQSVLVTHYLPQWVGRPGRRVVQIGGVMPIADRSLRSPFQHINSDAMALAGMPGEAPQSAALPSPIAAHVDDLATGFADQYRFLLRQRAALLAADSPLYALRDTSIRVILAATLTYTLISRKAQAYQHLDDGVEWSLQFELLCRGWLPDDVSPQRWRILAAERTALADLDIPMFTASAAADHLDTGHGEHIPGCLAGAPFDQMAARMAGLGEVNLGVQERLIRSAVAPQRSRYAASPGRPNGDLVALAGQLGAALERQAIRVDGHAAWIGVQPIDHEHGNLTVAGPTLYAGTAGIALFLAALARLSGEARWRGLALAAAAAPKVIRTAPDAGARAVRILGIGGATGLGSVIYGLVRVAALLDEPGLLAEAAGLAALIDDDRIADDTAYDVLDGAAGAILSLLALCRARPDPAVLARAVACGRHLVQSEIIENGVDRGRRVLLCGFSHGAAGIALALLRLHAVSGEAAFRDTAAGMLRYERRHFAPDLGNWADLRPGIVETACQWCHGATGIGLARLGCAGLLDDPHMPEEIETALATTAGAATMPVDHLCCGNFGRWNFLLSAGLRLARPELVRRVQALAHDRAARAVRDGGFGWRIGDDSLNPGLFQGIAGIGYELLRIAHPDRLPDIMLWD